LRFHCTHTRKESPFWVGEDSLLGNIHEYGTIHTRQTIERRQKGKQELTFFIKKKRNGLCIKCKCVCVCVFPFNMLVFCPGFLPVWFWFCVLFFLGINGISRIFYIPRFFSVSGKKSRGFLSKRRIYFGQKLG